MLAGVLFTILIGMPVFFFFVAWPVVAVYDQIYKIGKISQSNMIPVLINNTNLTNIDCDKSMKWVIAIRKRILFINFWIYWKEYYFSDEYMYGNPLYTFKTKDEAIKFYNDFQSKKCDEIHKNKRRKELNKAIRRMF